MIKYLVIKFQSTLPCGSDQQLGPVVERLQDISIHAPLRERQKLRQQLLKKKLFQSTLPCGSDTRGTEKTRCQENFNPRSLAGATEKSGKVGKIEKYFNPRSLAGATSRLVITLQRCRHFNPRSLAGATPLISLEAQDDCISIHAPLRERQKGIKNK